MKKSKIILSMFSIISLVFSSFASIAIAEVTPPTVDIVLTPGESASVNKVVDTPSLPPVLDVCLLEDETASFGDDIHNLQTAASDIYDNVVAVSPGAHFAVTGFRDYGDAWVYRLLSSMSPVKADWTTGIGLLTASGGGDWPEAQYDAIVAATDINEGCGWRDDPSVTRVLLVATDAAFHTPPLPYVNDHTSTVSALSVLGKEIIVIGLEAPDHLGNDPGNELDNLATATGGSVQVLSPNGTDIADAILAGLGNLPITVTPVPVNCDPLVIGFTPASQTVTSGDPASFVENIAVPNDTSLAGSSVQCTVEFQDENENVLAEQKISVEIPIAIDLNPDTAVNELGTPGQTHTVIASVTSDSALSSVAIPNALVNFKVVLGPNIGKSGSENTNSAGDAEFTYEAEQGLLGLGTDIIKACVRGKDGRVACDVVTKEWIDTMPPEAQCVETVNPHGKNIPPAGKTTLPGSKGGQNEDGFYEFTAQDIVDPDVEVFVEDTGSGTVFGPFASGVVIKYTEAPGTEPEQKKMGSDKGKAGAVTWHIIGNGDPVVYAVDSSGNVSASTTCLVPPLPK